MYDLNFKKALLSSLPLDRRAISKQMNEGCPSSLLRYLISRCWVYEETDSNDDLGFVFALKLWSSKDKKECVEYKLYLSCVLNYAALRYYQFADTNDASRTETTEDNPLVSESFVTMVKKGVFDSGFKFIPNELLFQELDSELKAKSGCEEGTYFNVLFSEY